MNFTVNNLLTKKIEFLKQDKLGLKKVNIFEVDFELLMKPSKDRFDKCNIKYDGIVNSNVQNGTISFDYGESDDIGGVTTFYILNGEIHSAVFIPACEPNESARLVKQYIALLHELGHADDMEHGVNFNNLDKVNVIKVESYAEVFALKHLDRNKNDDIDVFVKGLYANLLIKRAKKNDFYKNVHLEITKYFRENRLKNWSKNYLHKTL